MSRDATDKLTDDEMLKTVVICQNWGGVSGIAIDKIQDRAILSEFTSDEWPDEVRKAAMKRLQE